jgi:hypothetical protein
MALSARVRTWLLGLGFVLLLVIAVGSFGAWTAPERNSLRAYTNLISAANRGDLPTARSLCSTHYLETHNLRLASEGGLEGLPRGLHKNFQVWRQGRTVRLCPTNRVGPVYEFVREGTGAGWKFNGPIGILKGRGEFVPIADGAGLDSLEGQ